MTPYYLAVGQQSLSRGAYQFWLMVRGLTGNVGNVFDAMPATLAGNINNVKSDDPPMLGYFQVSARKQRIVYVRRTRNPSQPFAKNVFSFWPECEPCTESPYRTGTKSAGWQ